MLTISMPKMALGDDIETFLEVFERMAEVCGWPPSEWLRVAGAIRPEWACKGPLKKRNKLLNSNGGY